jgi:hypothetical protein
MRRCGRAYWLLLVCLLVTGVAAGGALAAPGGNSNNGKGHAGRGLALAKGHAKHAPAAPHSPSAPVKSTAPSGKDETRRSRLRSGWLRKQRPESIGARAI